MWRTPQPGCAPRSTRRASRSARTDRYLAGDVHGRRRRWPPAPTCQETPSPIPAGVMAIALRPNFVERFVGFGGRQGLAGAKHPDSALLLEGSCAAPRSQHELVTLHDQVESVSRGKPKLVPHSLGHDDATGSVKAHSA